MAIPVTTIYAQGALQGFIDTLAPVNVFSTNFTPDPAARGETVKFPLYNGYSSGAFAGNYTTNASNDVTERTITLNIHRYKTVKQTDLEAIKSSYAQIERLGYQAGAAVGTDFFQQVLAVVTNSNFGAAVFTGAASGFDSDDVVDIKNACDVAKMPATGRGLIVSSTYYNALLKDVSIKHATNYGTPSGIQLGLIPSLSGFTVYETTAMPGNDENLVGIAAVADGIGVAMRYLAPQGQHKYTVAQAMVDPRSGMTLGVRQWYNEETGTEYLAVEAFGGATVGVAAGCKRLVSA